MKFLFLLFLLSISFFHLNNSYANDNGTLFVSEYIGDFKILPDSKNIIYQNSTDGLRYKKGINEIGNGQLFLSVSFGNLKFSQDGNFVFFSNYNDGGTIYKKGINEIGDGEFFAPYSFSYLISPNSEFLIFGDDYLYKKDINGTGEIIQITNTYSSFPIISLDSTFLIYRAYNNGRKLFKKGINESGIGVEFTSVDSRAPQISPDGNFVFYRNDSDGSKIYLKGINEAGNGTELLSKEYSELTFFPTGNFVLYTNWDMGGVIYKKGINEIGDGNVFLPNNHYSFSSDGSFIIYRNENDSSKLYKKGIDEIGEGIIFIGADFSYSPKVSSDGKFIFYMHSSGYLYKKEMNSENLLVDVLFDKKLINLNIIGESGIVLNNYNFFVKDLKDSFIGGFNSYLTKLKVKSIYLGK